MPHSTTFSLDAKSASFRECSGDAIFTDIFDEPKFRDGVNDITGHFVRYRALKAEYKAFCKSRYNINMTDHPKRSFCLIVDVWRPDADVSYQYHADLQCEKVGRRFQLLGT
jgi:hypothetical protein